MIGFSIVCSELCGCSRKLKPESDLDHWTDVMSVEKFLQLSNFIGRVEVVEYMPRYPKPKLLITLSRTDAAWVSFYVVDPVPEVRTDFERLKGGSTNVYPSAIANLLR
jgi:hypothetical protein